jgi:alanine-alpha-ketoisovalerate/valine-pyruvate aminotransferase
MKPGYFLIPIFLIVIVVVSCSKGSTSKHPQLTLESTSTDSLAEGDSVTFMLKFQNSGGTLGSGNFFSVRVRLNQVPIPSQDSVGADTLVSQIPDFNGASKGEFKYVLGHDDLDPEANVTINDTLMIKFFAVTPNNDTSNVVTTSKPMIINP